MSSEPSRSDPGGVDAVLDDAASQILRRVRALVRPVVVIDGRSGSGKTSLAVRLADRWPGPTTVVGLDDLYPGWDGLDAGVEAAVTCILEPHAAGLEARWHRWDWAAGAYVDEGVVPAGHPLIVEGSGILTPATAALADVAVWLDSPTISRQTRAFARDGDLYRPHWDRWAAQEDRHVARDAPASLADFVVEVP